MSASSHSTAAIHCRWKFALFCFSLTTFFSTGLLVWPVYAAQVADAAPVLQPQFWSPNGSTFAIAQTEHTIYLGGQFTYVGPNTGPFATLDISSGSPTPQIPPVTGSIQAIAPDGSGGWYIGGTFDGTGKIPVHNLAHIRADHTLDPAWTPSIEGGGDDPPTVQAIAVHNKRVYIGGYFSRVNGHMRSNLASIEASTGRLTSWNPQASITSDPASEDYSSVHTLLVQGNTMYVGGYFTRVGGKARTNLAALSTTTGKATSWQPQPDGSVQALALQGHTLYVGGRFTHIGNTPRTYIAALKTTDGKVTDWQPQADDVVNTLAVRQTTVYAGGYFTHIGGQVRNFIAALDATSGAAQSWAAHISAASDSGTHVSALALSDTTVYVGGDFSQVGTTSRLGLAALDATTGAVSAWDPNPDSGDVYALAFSGSSIAVGGRFNYIGGVQRSNLAALDTTTGKATDWNPNPDEGIYAIALGGNTVYFSGAFSHVGQVAREKLAAVDATSGEVTPWNPQPNDYVNALAVKGQTVYAAGRFQQIGGASRNYIAALDATTGVASDWNPSANDTALDILPYQDTIYVAGYFTSIGGRARTSIAAINSTTGAVTDWNPNPSGTVYKLLARGNTLYVGGVFTRIGTQTRSNLAALSVNTGLARAWNPNIGEGWVESLALSGSTLYVGGGFDHIGSVPRNNFGAIDTVTGKVTDWNPNADDPEDQDRGIELAANATTLVASRPFAQPHIMVFHLAPSSTNSDVATSDDE